MRSSLLLACFVRWGGRAASQPCQTTLPTRPMRRSAAAAAEASLAAKGTASGLVRDVKFLDMDVAFWQVRSGMSCARHRELHRFWGAGCSRTGKFLAMDVAFWQVRLLSWVVFAAGLWQVRCSLPASSYSFPFSASRRASAAPPLSCQVARQHWLQYGAYDERTIPYMGEPAARAAPAVPAAAPATPASEAGLAAPGLA